MKNGRSLMELAQELERQRNAKRDYLLDTRNLEMGFVEAGAYQMMMRNDSKNVSTLLGVGEIAHRQIGSALGIPAKYYDKMRAENPELLDGGISPAAGAECEQLVHDDPAKANGAYVGRQREGVSFRTVSANR